MAQKISITRTASSNLINGVLPNNTYLQGRETTGTPIGLIGVNASNNVEIDPSGVGVIFGGNIAGPITFNSNTVPAAATTGLGADSSNNLFFNVPTGAVFKFAINDNLYGEYGVFGLELAISGTTFLQDGANGQLLIGTSAANFNNVGTLGNSTHPIFAIYSNYIFGTIGNLELNPFGTNPVVITTSLSISTGANMLTFTSSLTNNAGTSAGTLTNAPSVGNPTKWIPINDNGTTRNIPAW